ncbi:MAG: DUF2961 domain-containing protein [Sedimentisphaerales bacterium]|nr:DUF2961 domain-containing protein [Sedimentisphaerales bacterium]
MSKLKVLWVLLFFVGFANLVAVAEEPMEPLEELYRLDRLPQFKSSVKVGSLSSYDRTGGNDDGFSGKYSFIRKEDDGLVIAELTGPGVIYRIWTPTPTEDMVEFYFDGEKEPRIRVKFRDIFTGKHPVFVRPLVGYGAGGFYSYLPLSYKKSCKILMKTERLQFIQINYAEYAADTALSSFDPKPSGEYLRHLEKAKKLFASSGSDISSYALGVNAESHHYQTEISSINPGQSFKVFETDKPGRIVGLRVSPADAFVGKDRGIVLRAYWDDDKEPAILSPAGDFFGYYFGSPAVKSLLVGTEANVNYCYFPMPFDKSARIELFNDTNKPTAPIKAEIIFAPVPRKADEGKFYALWRRENPTTKGKPYTFIETEGRGHLVGCIQQSQGKASGSTIFFEGDDQTTIDGELVIHGTGSEDFYNGGWYDLPGRWDSRRSFVLSGCLGYQKHLGRTGGYRLMLGDAYSYRQSILQTIEHAPVKNERVNDYSSVAYLYSQNRPTCDFTIPDGRDREVIDFEKIIFVPGWNLPIHAFSMDNVTLSKAVEKVDKGNVRFLSVKAEDSDNWYGPHFIVLTCELSVAGKYQVSIEAVKGPAQGQVQLFVDEAPVSEVLDLYGETREKSGQLSLAEVDLVEGENHIMFKIVGKNEKSTGLNFDLSNIICERLEK